MRVREIALMLLAALLASLGLGCTNNEAESGLPPGTVQLTSAGATFPAPLYEKWLEVYQKQHPNVQLSYDPIGSGDGIKQFVAGSVDFGASDAAMSDEEIGKVERGVQLVPVVAGTIVLAYRLDGLGGDLKLPRDVYVDIFLNEITTWDDPRIQAANPGLKFPRETIARAVRQDSSGTTFAFTNHLSAISDKWRDRGPGVGTVIDWPGNAMVARGNEGVAGRIKQSEYSIGYVEYGTAQRAGLKMAWLENQAGQFIQPYGGSGLATLMNVEMPENLRVFFPDPAGADSYPIVTYSWLLLNKSYADAKKAATLKNYVKWCLTEGQAYNESLGYVRLAPKVVGLAVQAVEAIQ
jgi:phosphate transport system substrate-binding protein